MTKIELKHKLIRAIKTNEDNKVVSICKNLLDELKEATNDDIESLSDWDWGDSCHDLAENWYAGENNWRGQQSLEEKLREILYY